MCIDLHIYFLSYHKFYHKYHFLSFSSHALTLDAVVLGEGSTLELGWSLIINGAFCLHFSSLITKLLKFHLRSSLLAKFETRMIPQMIEFLCT